MNTQPLVHRAEPSDSYSGIPIHSAAGVHQVVLELLLELKHHSWVELGSGSGAFAARAMSKGLHIRPYDLDTSDWPLGIPATVLDLNEPPYPFADNSLVGVVSIEVVEHLRSPILFFREIKRILAPGGSFVFTTPNINSPVSLLLHFLRGEFFTFSKAMYFESGHVSILPDFLIDAIVEEAGLTIERKIAAGSVRSHTWLRTMLLRAASSALWLCAPGLRSRFQRIEDAGLCAIYVVSKRQ